jgi:hypothetical protein
LINAPARGAGGAKPAKDLVLAEGQPFKFGDLTITLVAIPGHTPGSLAFIFPVTDKGKTRIAGLFGGTVLTTGILTTDALKQYTQSISHYLDAAKTMSVEVELQNHPIFDGMPENTFGDLAIAPSLGYGADITWEGNNTPGSPVGWQVGLPVMLGINLGRYQLVLTPALLYERLSVLPDGILNAGGTVAFGRVGGPGFSVYPAVAVWKALDPRHPFVSLTGPGARLRAMPW